jgi:hypothetical protein
MHNSTIIGVERPFEDEEDEEEIKEQEEKPDKKTKGEEIKKNKK